MAGPFSLILGLTSNLNFDIPATISVWHPAPRPLCTSDHQAVERSFNLNASQQQSVHMLIQAFDATDLFNTMTHHIHLLVDLLCKGSEANIQ
jgi:hypothetical protein